jgi:aryl-alcohol dehydrogenase-like predicted oxidoreductase
VTHRQLGHRGPLVPSIGFGAWPIGGGLGCVDRAAALSTVRSAIEAGSTLIDTAEGYRSSEVILGEALAAGRRDRVFLASKVSLDYSPAAIRIAMEKSLRALRTDHVDLYQIHSWNPAFPIERSMETMRRLQEEGKTRFVGVSNFLPEHLERVIAVCPIVSNQVKYSLLFRDIERDGTIAWCGRHGIGIIVHSPLAKGLLTGKYAPGSTFPTDDERSGFPDFQGNRFAGHLEKADRLAAIASAKGVSLVQLAVAWTLVQPVVSCTLVGAKTPSQTREHAGAADFAFTARELASIEAALAEQPAADS